MKALHIVFMKYYNWKGENTLFNDLKCLKYSMYVLSINSHCSLLNNRQEYQVPPKSFQMKFTQNFTKHINQLCIELVWNCFKISDLKICLIKSTSQTHINRKLCFTLNRIYLRNSGPLIQFSISAINQNTLVSQCFTHGLCAKHCETPPNWNHKHVSLRSGLMCHWSLDTHTHIFT